MFYERQSQCYPKSQASCCILCQSSMHILCSVTGQASITVSRVRQAVKRRLCPPHCKFDAHSHAKQRSRWQCHDGHRRKPENMLCFCHALHSLLDSGGSLLQAKLSEAVEERRRAAGDAEALKSQSKVHSQHRQYFDIRNASRHHYTEDCCMLYLRDVHGRKEKAQEFAFPKIVSCATAETLAERAVFWLVSACELHCAMYSHHVTSTNNWCGPRLPWQLLGARHRSVSVVTTALKTGAE